MDRGSKKVGMPMCEEWWITVWQRSLEIVAHKECAVEAGRRNDGKKVSSKPPPAITSGRTGVSLLKRRRRRRQLNCIGDKSRQRGSSLLLTLTDLPASFSVAQSLFEIRSRLLLQNKAATVTCFKPHNSRAINT